MKRTSKTKRHAASHKQSKKTRQSSSAKAPRNTVLIDQEEIADKENSRAVQGVGGPVDIETAETQEEESTNRTRDISNSECE